MEIISRALGEARCREVTRTPARFDQYPAAPLSSLFMKRPVHHAGSRARVELKAGEKPFRKGARGKKEAD